MRPRADPAGPGQESVWAYPRPAIAEPTSRRLRIVHRGVVVADTVQGVRTLETSHPPTYYVPRADVAPSVLRPVDRRSFCEWKGWAVYYDVEVPGERLDSAAWSYPAPTPGFDLLKDHLAFYAAPFDSCTVDGEQVRPQPGGFYGGWITAREAGPFKGGPGSQSW
ncbi:DUF427 domain-containing protein [Caulobacter sp. S45]|uniref:DUF427 domain-containing protein n=1 Tax=Caulobacter sp. S45 TaxID=1641861 RepID=UPI001575A26B|nr:DUF427 domain-containing protein [Caulobacter sp. S45]